MTRTLPEYRLRLEPTDETAKRGMGFPGVDPVLGQRHKIGGRPDFIQDEWVPPCRSCKKEMTFYGQLDSVGPEVCLADAGMIYVFFCFDCLKSTSFFQTY
jgi:hypothetical protein